MMKTENEMNVNVPLEVVKASEIEPREVKWLWYPYIPFGKVTLLQGDPGDGKSKLMLSIAALLSKGEGGIDNGIDNDIDKVLILLTDISTGTLHSKFGTAKEQHLFQREIWCCSFVFNIVAVNLLQAVWLRYTNQYLPQYIFHRSYEAPQNKNRYIPTHGTL